MSLSKQNIDVNVANEYIGEVPWPAPIEVTVDFKRKHILYPERALIDCGVDDQGKHHKTPLGVVCYGQRRKGAKGNRHTWSVHHDTLIDARKPVVANLINWLCENYSNGSPKTKANMVAYLRAVFDWMDKHYLVNEGASIDFKSVKSLKNMYFAYTSYLKHLIFLGQTGSQKNPSAVMSRNGAILYQVSARALIKTCLGLDEEVIKSWAEVLNHKSHSYRLGHLQNDDALDRFHSQLIQVIEAHYQIHVLRNQTIINSEKWGWLTGTRMNYDRRGYNLATIEGHYNTFTLIGFYFMVLATGQNEAPLLSLKVNESQLNRLNKTSYRVGIKRRAKGKNIIIEMGSEHKPIFEKYIAVRNIIAPLTNDYLFPDCKPQSAKAVNPAKSISMLWVNALGGKIFRARALRKFYARRIGLVAQSLGSPSGALNGIIAMMLQNEPLTACQYSIEGLEQAAEPLSQFLGQLHDACIEKGRSQSKINVKFTDHRDSDRSTPTGSCNSTNVAAPELEQGFYEGTNLPVCGKWETCLFCKHYSVHADLIDLKKLLSLKAVVEVMHQGMDEGIYAKRFSVLLSRVNEVIGEMITRNPSLENNLKTIEDDCLAGELDDFWSIYMRTLKLNGYNPGELL